MFTTSTNLLCPTCSTTVGSSEKINILRKVRIRINESVFDRFNIHFFITDMAQSMFPL
jgi:hypothetical protein